MRSFFVILAVLTVLSTPAFAADKPAVKPDAVASLSTKLDEVLKNQKEIFKQLAELKQEVLIVKARATR